MKIADIEQLPPEIPRTNLAESSQDCINYEDGCEEWAGCPCVYYKAESEDMK